MRDGVEERSRVSGAFHAPLGVSGTGSLPVAPVPVGMLDMAAALPSDLAPGALPPPLAPCRKIYPLIISQCLALPFVLSAHPEPL